LARHRLKVELCAFKLAKEPVSVVIYSSVLDKLQPEPEEVWSSLVDQLAVASASSRMVHSMPLQAAYQPQPSAL
jgi:hypothetical protein